MIYDRYKFLVAGASVSDPIFSLSYNEQLVIETYPKLYVDAKGNACTTTAPVGLLLGCDNYRVCELVGNNYNLYVAFDRASWRENPLWKSWNGTPEVRGDFVLMRWCRGLIANAQNTIGDVATYFELPPRKRSAYKFSSK